MPKSEILHKIEEYKDLYDFDEIVPVSAVKGDNIDRLISILKGKLTDNIKYYEDDVVTNVSNSFMISEIIREKILELTHEEVPHSVNVVTEDISYDKKYSSTYGIETPHDDNEASNMFAKYLGNANTIKEFEVFDYNNKQYRSSRPSPHQGFLMMFPGGKFDQGDVKDKKIK